jgi:hypothetical protein
MGGFQVNMPAAFVLGSAVEVAAARESPLLEPSDLLAGLYMSSSKRLSKYWGKVTAFGRLVSREPGIRGVIASHRKGEFPTPVDVEQIKLRRGFVPFSAETALILETARQLGASRAGTALGERPVVTPEDLLLAIAKHKELDVGQRLLGSGLDLHRLEKAVMILKPRPA